VTEAHATFLVLVESQIVSVQLMIRLVESSVPGSWGEEFVACLGKQGYWIPCCNSFAGVGLDNSGLVFLDHSVPCVERWLMRELLHCDQAPGCGALHEALVCSHQCLVAGDIEA
jgi:hypothetical protein